MFAPVLQRLLPHKKESCVVRDCPIHKKKKQDLTIDREAFMRKERGTLSTGSVRQMADAQALKMLKGSMIKPEDVYVKQDGEFVTKDEVERASRAMTKQALTMHKLKSEHNWIVVHQIGKQDARKLCVKCGSLKEIKDGDRDVFGPITETLDPFTNQPLER